MLLGSLLATWALADPSPVPAHAMGWSEGQMAAGIATALAPQESVTIQVPEELAALITGPMVLFYFSPTCSHCIEAMKEVGPLASDGDLPWLGITVGGASEMDIQQFMVTFEDPFPIWHDAEQAFAYSVGARSTPNVYMVEPHTTEVPESEEGLAAIEVTEAYLPYSRGMGAVLQMRSNRSDPFGKMHGYQGDLLCSQCHEQEARSWALTHHSIAYRTLYMRDDATRTECVSCHVTGLDEPDGFVMGDHGSPLSGVGCEACHGPSGPHDGESTDAQARCVECHDAEHSVAFEVSRALPHIDHYRASAMSEEELNASLLSLIEGEAERPLLAFPDGQSVGAKACRSCHKTQHQWFKSDPHASAMSTLGEDATRPECVRCHATEAHYDSSLAGMDGAPATLDDFRVDEGVGCESCHGPGSAHIESPSKSNIVGLGKSCPECIIEGICTSCHTPKWDMKWNLETRLEAIAH
jgi:hypothetical protein